MLVETAREMVYVKGIRPSAKAVSDLLASRSLTPTQVSYSVFLNSYLILISIQNAFLECLSKYGLEFHSLFVVDLMHEFELGVWKATFTHLLQILYAQGGDSIQTLNKRSLAQIFVIFVYLTLLKGTEKSPHLATTQFTSLYTMLQA